MNLQSMTLSELRKVRADADDKIQAAYWAFTRQAGARPPVLVVPEAYKVRSAADAEIQRRGVACWREEQ